MEELFLGIDAGTQGIKVGVCDRRGEFRAKAERKWGMTFPHVGWAEQDPEEWWKKIQEAIRACSGQLTESERAGIVAGTVCATSSTAFPVSQDGKPLYPALMWMDARSREEMAAINKTRHVMLQYCGGAVSFEWLIPKVLWLRKHEPGIYESCFRIVEQLDWINFRLSGVWCASKCNATCKWNYSDSAGGFSEDFFRTVGFAEYKEKILTDIRKMGDVIGPIRPELASEFGFSPDMRIVERSIDAHTAMFGMNAIAERKMGVILGTSFAHMSQVRGRPIGITGIWGPYEHCMEEDKWLLESGQITAGGLVNWFRDTFHPPLDPDQPYRTLAEAVLETEPGADGITILDFFQGNRTPYKNPDAKGVIYGLNIQHSWKQVYRALLESISFGSRNIIDNQIRQGYDVDLIVGCGGVTKDPVWMQMIADITDKTIAVNEENEAGVLGGCVLAASNGRCYGSFQEAADTMVRIQKQYVPDKGRHEQYEKPYRKYLELYRRLQDFMEQD